MRLLINHLKKIALVAVLSCGLTVGNAKQADANPVWLIETFFGVATWACNSFCPSEDRITAKSIMTQFAQECIRARGNRAWVGMHCGLQIPRLCDNLMPMHVVGVVNDGGNRRRIFMRFTYSCFDKYKSCNGWVCSPGRWFKGGSEIALRYTVR